jgi:hypothetical protein
MTKGERIVEIQTKIDMLKSILEPHLKELNALEKRLKQEKDSFDIGMKVTYEKVTCERGCCSVDHDCVVESRDPKDEGFYNLRRIKDNMLMANIHYLDLKETR